MNFIVREIEFKPDLTSPNCIVFAQIYKKILTKPPEQRLETELIEILHTTRHNKFFMRFSIPDQDRLEVCVSVYAASSKDFLSIPSLTF